MIFLELGQQGVDLGHVNDRQCKLCVGFGVGGGILQLRPDAVQNVLTVPDHAAGVIEDHLPGVQKLLNVLIPGLVSQGLHSRQEGAVIQVIGLQRRHQRSVKLRGLSQIVILKIIELHIVGDVSHGLHHLCRAVPQRQHGGVGVRIGRLLLGIVQRLLHGIGHGGIEVGGLLDVGVIPAFPHGKLGGILHIVKIDSQNLFQLVDILHKIQVSIVLAVIFGRFTLNGGRGSRLRLLLLAGAAGKQKGRPQGQRHDAGNGFVFHVSQPLFLVLLSSLKGGVF